MEFLTPDVPKGRGKRSDRPLSLADWMSRRARIQSPLPQANASHNSSIELSLK
jgi:hypothetical protein